MKVSSFIRSALTKKISIRPDYITPSRLRDFIRTALKEDIGDGDHSSEASIPDGTQGKAQLIIKEEGLLAGMEVVEEVWRIIDPELSIEILLQDGETVTSGMIGFTISGNSKAILKGERLVLNILQRMSGIATKTRKIADMLYGTKAKVLDTRKTTPGFRMMEKWAVLIGGGFNHRFGLYDKILLKDNHIDMAGGVVDAIRQTKEYLLDTGLELSIEVETRTLEEVKSVLMEGGVETIMLDNMMPSQMREAVQMIGSKCLIEASGGITETTILEVAETGVDFISVGALTHSYKSIDMSLKAV